MTLARRPRTATAVPDLDEHQRAVLESHARTRRVLGSPGTGKTTLAIEVIADAVARDDVTVAECLMFAPTRRAAARLRDRVTARVAGTSSGPLARTPHSFAFGVLRRWAASAGAEVPRLITGPEQDVILRDLLEGYAAEPGLAPDWPSGVAGAVATRTFRGELRDLLMRAIELGLGADDLRALGVREGRDEWVAAAQVLRDYDEVTALSTPGALDPAWLLGAATARLVEDRALLDQLRREIRLVVVDDAQELTPAGAALVSALCSGGGPRLVLLGDPDASTQTFRGAEPGLFIASWPDAEVHRLRTGHRLPPDLQVMAERVTAHIGVVGGAQHRRPTPKATRRTGHGPGQVHGNGDGHDSVHLFRTTAQEAGWIADRLRRRHLLDGVPWSEMAVIVRGGSASASVERALRRAGVPIAGDSGDRRALREHPVVRPFLTIATAVLAAPDGPPTVSVDDALDLVTSPIGGCDAVALRRLRRALRGRELASGGGLPSGELIAQALVEPEVLAGVGAEGAGARRVARIVAAAVRAARDDSAASGIESILWAMWSESGLAPVWQGAALAGGAAGRRADVDLDAMVSLFDAAARFAERLPGSSPAAFLEHLRSQELAADSLAVQAPAGEAVSLVTPADAAGREWETVCVAGVQEGVWPDVRLRGALLGVSDLVDLHRGRPLDRRAARLAVLHDETRLLLVAVTRARSELLVSAVRSEDAQPSAYLDVLDPRPGGSAREFTDLRRSLSLPGLVGELRQALVGPSPERRAAAVSLLADLVQAGVPGADPTAWWPLRDLSDRRPRRSPEDVVRVSPSRLDRFGKCQLQWFLSACGGQGPETGAADIGNLVHAVAHDLGDTTAEAYAEVVRERWGTLGLGEGWLADRSLAEAVAMTGRLANYVSSSSAAGWQRTASEVGVDVTIGRARITGTVDRVEVDPDGRVRIIDLKTGASKPRAEDMPRHQQLGAYQLAVDHGGLGTDLTSAGAALLQLGKGSAATKVTLQVQQALSDDDDPQWAAAAVAADAEAMAGAVFTATPGGGLCGTCQVASSCPATAQGRQLG